MKKKGHLEKYQKLLSKSRRIIVNLSLFLVYEWSNIELLMYIYIYIYHINLYLNMIVQHLYKCIRENFYLFESSILNVLPLDTFTTHMTIRAVLVAMLLYFDPFSEYNTSPLELIIAW
jgi:hypothetical protein